MTDGTESATIEDQERFAEIANFYYERFKESVQSNRDIAKMDEVRFSRLTAMALSSVASIVAVDCLMTEAQFLAVCKANFETAYKRAPKFA